MTSLFKNRICQSALARQNGFKIQNNIIFTKWKRPMNGQKKSKTCNATFIRLISDIRSDPKFAKLKYITGVGKYGEILANALEPELELKAIEVKDAILYPVEQVLVISDTLENTNKLKSYEKRGYLTYVLWQEDQ